MFRRPHPMPFAETSKAIWANSLERKNRFFEVLLLKERVLPAEIRKNLVKNVPPALLKEFCKINLG
jgi:hypothetical protein